MTISLSINIHVFNDFVDSRLRVLVEHKVEPDSDGKLLKTVRTGHIFKLVTLGATETLTYC